MERSEALSSNHPEEWAEEFRRRYGTFERLTDKLTLLLEELLDRASVAHVPIEARTKSVEGFIEKVSRKGDAYPQPLRDMPDLIGLRVIVYYAADRQAVGDLLEQEFVIDWDRSTGEREARDPDRFGYESAHYIVSLRDDRAGLSDWADYRAMHAEVQVRTVLQHAWAAISHKLDYKSEVEVPRELRRQLFRLSALLELADDEFDGLRTDTAQVEARYEERIGAGDLDIELNAASLETYGYVTGSTDRWQALALEAGFRPLEVTDPYDRSYDRTSLLNVLDAENVRTLEEFDDLLSASEDSGQALLGRIAKQATEDGHTPVATPLDVLTILILATRQPDDEVLEATEFRDEIQNAIRALRS